MEIIKDQTCNACGYRYIESEDENLSIEKIRGDEEFFEIHQNEFPFIIERRSKYGEEDIIDFKKIYACPKCGTLTIL